MPRIVFDMKEGRPACALLQAALGGDSGMAGRFNNEAWLLSPTPDMRVYEVTDSELEKVAALVNHRHPTR